MVDRDKLVSEIKEDLDPLKQIRVEVKFMVTKLDIMARHLGIEVETISTQLWEALLNRPKSLKI